MCAVRCSALVGERSTSRSSAARLPAALRDRDSFSCWLIPSAGGQLDWVVGDGAAIASSRAGREAGIVAAGASVAMLSRVTLHSE